MDTLFGVNLPIQDPVLLFGVCMAIILITPLVFAQIKLPSIIGPIVAGVVLGPSVLNVLERGQAIELLGRVGLLYIMFLAGLEIDMTQFRKHRNRSIVFGCITFIIPQTAGMIIFRALGFDWLASILIASMFASHTLVAYPVISRLGILKNNAVTTTVGGTILTDTVALLVLVVVARSTQGELDAMFWVSLVLSIAIFVTAVLYLLPPLTRWFFRNIGDGGKTDFIFVLTVVFLCAYLAGAVGTEAILGAFLAGLVLNPLIPERSQLMSRIQFFGETFIIPFFLLFIGLLVDVTVLGAGLTAWVVMGTMLTTNVGTKWVASTITSRIYKYSKAENWVIFGLSTCEAAATLAATLVGYELGIIGDEVLNGVVMMIFATCILGPWVVERYGREVARQESERPYEPREAPQRILVPLANPATSEMLIEVAAMLRDRNSSEAVFPLTVVPERKDNTANIESNVATAERLLAHAVVHAAEMNLPVNPVTRVAANPAIGIVDAATERRVSDIIVGWNGERSPRQRIFGSVIDQMLDQANSQVLVCKVDHPINTYRRLITILPTFIDYNSGFYEAVRTIKSFAMQLGVDLKVFIIQDDLQRVQRHWDEVKSELISEIRGLGSWADLKTHLEETLTNTDLVMFLSARQGTMAYTSYLERLPRDLAELQTSFLVLYPSQKETLSSLANVQYGLPELLHEQQILLGMNTASYEKTVEALLDTTMTKEDSRHWSVLKALVYDDVGYASEILPRVIISHARVRELKETMMFLGIHSTGVTHEKATQPISVIVLLLSPAQLSSQDHLSQLSEVARYFSHTEKLEDLIRCQSLEEIKGWFSQKVSL